jgi:hypothetical protein
MIFHGRLLSCLFRAVPPIAGAVRAGDTSWMVLGSGTCAAKAVVPQG